MARSHHSRQIRQTMIARYRAAYQVKNGCQIPAEVSPQNLGSGWWQVGSEKVRTADIEAYYTGMDIYALDAMKA